MSDSTPVPPWGIASPSQSVSSAAPKLANRQMVRAVSLPSLGLPYDDKVPNGQVLISAMTVADEKILATPSSSSTDLVSVLLERTCDLHGVAADDLILADSMFLLIQLRVLSYGAKMMLEQPCESCRAKVSMAFDIEHGVEFTSISDSWVEPFEVALPASGKKIGVRLLRSRDQKTIDAKVRSKEVRARSKGEDARDAQGDRLALLLSRQVATVDGHKLNDIAAQAFVESLLVVDRCALTDAVNDNSPQMISNLSATCTSCGYANEMEFRVTPEFFRVVR